MYFVIFSILMVAILKIGHIENVVSSDHVLIGGFISHPGDVCEQNYITHGVFRVYNNI